ncbi:MAG: AtpZ/AtpI family protein [Cyclobacteriaceae bacterium]|nr:AtpZ/AtpI family protein [Cyclobacteriaceae bacterium]MCX7637061.1 AtpZ/AtpI family protein [Cyclobacteriaceae bacterium]MDW8331185.1 AtpZ/AtpI family protein [Cyclobacteriaceae bacterium]
MGTEPAPTEPSRPKPFNAYLKYSTLAIQLLATLALFGWLGYKLDRYLNITFPLFMMLFGLLAFAGMMYQLYRSLNR